MVESNRRPDKRYRFEQAQDEIAAKGGQIAAIMPDQQHFTAGLKAESHAPFPILTDIDNGYAMSLNLAFWVGAEMQELMTGAGWTTSLQRQTPGPDAMRLHEGRRLYRRLGG